MPPSPAQAVPRIGDRAIAQLFTEARSYSGWEADDVTEQDLRDLYDLLKWGPTSANCCPARFVFVRPGPAQERLAATLMEGNVAKVRAAPVTAIIAQDTRFYEQVPRLFPHAPQFRDMFAKDARFAAETMFRNSSLQGAYFMLAARAIGLDCGPMSGFDNARLDAAFFPDGAWKSNFLCCLGHGDRATLKPRSPRLGFEEACRVLGAEG